MVSAAQAIRIPDWMSPNPGFMLDAGVPGTEGVMCLASAQDPLLKLPAALQAPALTVIGQYKGLASVREAFVAALGESGVVEQSVQWRVVPRQARSRQP
jgi:hypothetical protein